MKALLRFALEVIVSCALIAILIVFIDTREANQRLDLVEYKDSLMLEKMKELVDAHNQLVSSHNQIIEYITEDIK